MNISFSFEGQELRITTKHAASSYGWPVLLVNGELTDIPVHMEHDDGDATGISGDAKVHWPD